MTLTGKHGIRNSKLETMRVLSVSVYLVVGAALVLSCGCQPAMESLRPCAGKPTAAAAIQDLNARTAKMLPLKASGRCIIEYYDEDGRKRRESFPAIVRTMPPHGLYFQGNLIIPKGLILGANAEEFWLWIKLKEVDTFWNGRLGQCVSEPALLLAPESVLESLGYVGLPPDSPGGYSFQHKSPYDVVTMWDGSGRIAGRVWIYSCDSSPRKIEYYTAEGKLFLTTKLSRYAAVTPDFAVPTQIEMSHSRSDGRIERLSITLNKDVLEVFEPTPRQADVLFTRPDPAGTKHIFILQDDCTFVEANQSQ